MMTLQKQLTWTGILIVLVPMLVSTGIMWLLIHRQNDHDAIERSEKLLRIVCDELGHQREELLAEMQRFSQDTTLMNSITYLVQGGNVAEELKEFYKIEIGRAMATFANMNGYNMLMLFDHEHVLASYVQRENSEQSLGLVSLGPENSAEIKTIANERVIMGQEEANASDWMLAVLPKNVPLRDAESAPESLSTMAVFQDRLAIKTALTIRSISGNPDSTLLGRLVGYRYLDQELTNRLAAMTLGEINFFLGSRFSTGTLDGFSTLAETSLRELEQLTAEPAEKPYLHTEYVIDEHPYYQLYFPFVRQDNGSIQGVLTLSLSKEPTYRKTREVVILLGGVLFVCVLIIIPITLALSRKIARPIREMATISEAIAEGAIEQEINPSISHDEIGSLSRSFHAMILYLRSMATMARAISRGEIAQEIRPRSERDTLGKAFQRMTLYMQEIAKTAARIADGDLRQEFQPQSEQDVLGGAFRKMTALRHMLAQIVESSEHIRSASGQLQVMSHQMSTDAEKASQKIELVSSASQQSNQIIRQVAAAVEEFSASVSEISRNTFEVADVANKSVKLTESASIAITGLEGQSQEISEITEVITSITGQTHLLALNATIEAARAGESGKGFAVVADEVKTLAQEIASSADDITQKIETVQLSSQKAVSAIGEVSERITQTDEIVHAIASSLEQQTSISNEIVNNIAEVSSGSDDVAGSIAEVSTVSQHISERAGTVRKSALELADLADQLHQLVERFKI